ncbi:uncharacterized protein A4U43_C08F3870 [Asparagus officinalis]|nr:uncharacterized protein A4U43_C08F3870 [Asparagus officinalis]
MGNGVSSIEGGAHETAMGDLPESCVARVLMDMGPAEICSLARLNRTFWAAAAAGGFWERRSAGKLWGEGRRRFIRGFVGILSSMEAQRCYTVGLICFLEGVAGIFVCLGEFWMVKHTGGVCMSISSKAMLITGINDRRYWNYIPTEESRFHTVAYLQQIWWLEVGGEIDFFFPKGTYSLFFRLHLGRASRRLGRRICSPQHIHGWDIQPVRFHLSTSDGQRSQSKCYLDEPGSWILYHVGDFDVKDSRESTTVKFSMVQIDCTHTKGGLCVDSVLIYPKGFRPKEAPLSYNNMHG